MAEGVESTPGAGTRARPQIARPAAPSLAAQPPPPRPLPQVDDPAKRGELGDLFGLTPEEREDVLGAGNAAMDRVRQQTGGDDEDGFF